MLIRVDGRRQTYGFSVDYWSYGCVVYEMLSGKCPFRTEAARSLDPDKHKARCHGACLRRHYIDNTHIHTKTHIHTHT